MANSYFNGNWLVASQHGPIVPGVDPISRGRVWKQTMKQRVNPANPWVPLDLDTLGPLLGDPPEPSGYLIEETTPTREEGDIVKWERIFAEVPASHKLGESYSYLFPKYVEGPPSTFKVGQGSIRTNIIIECEYTLTLNPEHIPLGRKPVFLTPSDLLSAVGPYLDGELIMADDSTIERYLGRGNIWCRKTPYVTKETLLAAYYSTTTSRIPDPPPPLPPVLP